MDIGLIRNADDETRLAMRRSTIRYKQGLQSTATIDSMHSLSEDQEYSDDDSDDGETAGCKCLLM